MLCSLHFPNKMDLRLVVVLVVFVVATVAQERYTTKFDYLHVEAILRNNRLLKSYYKCLVDQGPCTQEGNELRKVLPDAFKTRCRKCSPIQKKNARKVVEHVMKYKPDIWQGILKKYDPKGIYTRDILTDPKFLG